MAPATPADAAARECLEEIGARIEPPELFAPLEHRFGEHAPRIRVADPEVGPQLDLGNGSLGLPLAGFFLANVDFSDDELATIDRHAVDAGVNIWKASSDG